MDSYGTGAGGGVGGFSRVGGSRHVRGPVLVDSRSGRTWSATYLVGGTGMELPLADVVPLWRTFRDEDLTVLVTPALDYVGGLELGTKDVRFEGPDTIAQLGESLRSLVSSLDDGSTILFLYRVTDDVEDVIAEYENASAPSALSPLRAYVVARGQWLRSQRLRRVRVFLFFSAAGDSLSKVGRGALGGKLVFANVDALSEERHEAELKSLCQLRDRLVGRLAQAG